MSHIYLKTKLENHIAIFEESKIPKYNKNFLIIYAFFKNLIIILGTL